MGINTGLRVSDILKLKLEDVCTSRGKILDFISMRENKTGKPKRFPINNNTKKALQELIQTYNLSTGDYLFQSRKGENKPISRVQAWNIINAAAKTVGITDPIGTHTLRKTFGYHAYKQGTDLALIQEILNHRSQKDTKRYIGITQDDIDNVYISLNL